MTRALWLGLLALVLLATEAAPARADIPPGPSPRRPDPVPAPPGPPQPAEWTGMDRNPPREPGRVYTPLEPKRTGPFRSCGSGMGTGLAGIGLAWGMLWLGTRFARNLRSPSARG